ncbi:nucleolin 1-like isoform X1 [Raphanus sativus]|nr:nucleolin 1-like isoform X1 [Raphanus sativus]
MDGSGNECLPNTAESHQRKENFVRHMKEWMDICARTTMIRVEGFNTSSDRLVLYRALKDLFETCGEVENIEIRVDPESKLIRSCLVILLGEGAKEKALLLNGSEVEGRKLTLSAVEPTDGLTTSARAAKYVEDFQKNSCALVHLYGLGSLQRAVRLNGTDIGGGFTLTVEAMPYQVGRGLHC